ncbi:MAG: hypothetical protein KJN76_06430 [Eudoraea sp.]|nr:hypothetical protein [Eudoraea sp.]
MKSSPKTPAFYFSLLMTLIFISCQKESVPDQQQQSPQAIMESSLLVKLISDVSANDGSYDNIVDGASCLAIKFPYTVVVNGEEIIIDSAAKFSEIELRFDADEFDEDTLEIQYPVTVVLPNFTQIEVEDDARLNALAAQCIEGGDDVDNECIDFIYPIAIFTFDVNNEQLGRVEVESDAELRLFFTSLDDNARVSFDFPISLLLHNGEEVVVESNIALVQAISGAANTCDEDDDNDYNDDDFTKDRLDALLTSCTWLIKEIAHDDTNVSEEFYLSGLSFGQNGTVEFEGDSGNAATGSWNTVVDGVSVVLNIEFNTLTALNNSWSVYELEAGKIKLQALGANKIVLQSACVGYNDDGEALKAILKECSWIIKNVRKGEDIQELVGYDLSFFDENAVIMEQGTTSINGSWEVSYNAGQTAVLSINMESNDPNINFDWPLEELGYERLRFKNESGDHRLRLEKNCYNDSFDEEVVNTRMMISSGGWQVASFVHNSDPDFITYNETFFFAADGIFKLENTQIGAQWHIYRNSEQELELVLTFEAGSNYQYLGNDWEIVVISEEYIELVHEDDPNDYDHLIFQRP